MGKYSAFGLLRGAFNGQSHWQPAWRDPETGYLRRDVAPANTGSSQNIVRVELPAGARVAYPAAEQPTAKANA